MSPAGTAAGAGAEAVLRAGAATDRTGVLAVLGLLALLAALTGVALLRPLMPVDETRYAAVAWEMWERGDLLLPVLNGEPYSHKPPLLFWLMQGGWAVFGVGPAWPRVIAPLFAAATLTAAMTLARALWPDRPALARRVPWLLLALPLFTVFSTALMFDMVLSCFVAIAWCGLVRAATRGLQARDFALLALGLAGALYAKGPVALVHLLPAALLAPWWARDLPRRRWALGVGWALAAAAAAILAWAVPAAMAGGPTYRDAIFWHQSAARLNDSFAHAAPAWYYLQWLPLLLLPWLVWPPAWAAARRLASGGDRTLRFLAVAGGAAFVFFSLASGKRLHYLLPEFTLVALLLARALDELPRRARARRSGALPMALLLAAVGAVMLGVSGLLAARLNLGSAVLPLRLAAAVPLLAAVAMALAGLRGHAAGLRAVAAAWVLSLLAVLLGLDLSLRARYDVGPVAALLASHERAGRPLAMRGNYAGEWTFAGRLTRPLQEVEADAAPAWLAAHPQGRLVFIHKQPAQLPAGARVEFRQRYRDSWLVVLAPAASAPRATP